MKDENGFQTQINIIYITFKNHTSETLKKEKRGHHVTQLK